MWMLQSKSKALVKAVLPFLLLRWMNVSSTATNTWAPSWLRPATWTASTATWPHASQSSSATTRRTTSGTRRTSSRGECEQPTQCSVSVCGWAPWGKQTAEEGERRRDRDVTHMFTGKWHDKCLKKSIISQPSFLSWFCCFKKQSPLSHVMQKSRGWILGN